MISVCRASRLSAVSLSDSPFWRLELDAEMFTTSALNLNAASSKEVLVRVLGSTKKLTSVLPRNAGTFLISRAPTVLKAPAESRIVLISEAANSRMLRRSLRTQFSFASMNTAEPTLDAKENWVRKDLLSIRELAASEINTILDSAGAFKTVGARDIKKVPALRGKTLVNFFVEPSTRTRTSFELAAFRLSADVVNISASSSSLQKGESLKDTALNLEALHTDIIVLRHSAAGASKFLAERLAASVINAGDGAHEHPTQALLDVFTIRERLGRIAGLKVAIVGDILFSRVARSNLWALKKLGADVFLVGPSTLVPRSFESMGVSVVRSLDDILGELDVINLLRIQHERQRKEYFPSLNEYVRFFGLTKERAERLKPHCLIMHPGPINRGVEIDSDLADGPQSVILDQVANGLAVRMAVLYLCSTAARKQR